MRITLFSFIMSILWGSIMIILIHFCRKRPRFVRKLGVRNLLFLYFFSVIRMMVPYEFSFARVLPLQGTFQELERSFNLKSVDTAKPSLLQILAIVWAVVSLALLLQFLCHYMKAVRTFSRYRVCEDAQYQRVFQQVMNETGSQMAVTIRRSRHVSVPMGVGICKKSILLPEEHYSDPQLYYILLHEYTHFRNRDLLIKIMVHIISCIFWWNPAVYLLKKDLAQILEIRCDLTVTEHMEDRDKATYLTTIVSVLKNAGARRQARAFYSATALVAECYESETVERFRFVSAASADRNRHMLFTISWFLALITLFYISYSVTVHPGYKVPVIIHVTEKEPEVYEAEVEDSFVNIMKSTENTYVYLPGR